MLASLRSSNRIIAKPLLSSRGAVCAALGSTYNEENQSVRCV